MSLWEISLLLGILKSMLKNDLHCGLWDLQQQKHTLMTVKGLIAVCIRRLGQKLMEQGACSYLSLYDGMRTYRWARKN